MSITISLQLKTDLETDLFVAHCKIESLETCLEQFKVRLIHKTLPGRGGGGGATLIFSYIPWLRPFLGIKF